MNLKFFLTRKFKLIILAILTSTLVIVIGLSFTRFLLSNQALKFTNTETQANSAITYQQKNLISPTVKIVPTFRTSKSSTSKLH